MVQVVEQIRVQKRNKSWNKSRYKSGTSCGTR